METIGKSMKIDSKSIQTPDKSHASQIRRLVPGIQHGHHMSRAPQIRFEDFLQVVTSRRRSVHDQAELVVDEEAWDNDDK